MKKFFKKIGEAIAGRRGIGTTLTVCIIATVVLLNVLAYTLTNAFDLYFYEKYEQDFSLVGAVAFDEEHLVDKLGKKVKITFCQSVDPDTIEARKNEPIYDVWMTAKEFEKKYPRLIEVHSVNMITKLDEDGNIYDFDKYTKDGKYNINSSSVIFECGEGENHNFRVVTDNVTTEGFSDFYTLNSNKYILAYNGEEVMSSMISWVLTDEHPTVYLTQGHGETADISFSNILTCAGYYVNIINLRKEEIPSDAGMLIISAPTSDFWLGDDSIGARGEIEKIKDYLSHGGKLYVSLDPYVKALPNLESLLSDYGISLSGRQDDSGRVIRDIVKESSSAITPDGYTFVANHADGSISESIFNNVNKHGDGRVLVSNVSRLLLDDEKGAFPILVSGTTSETYAGGERTDGKGSYAVAAASVREEELGTSCVFVLPTVHIVSSSALLSEGYSNKDFLYSVLEELFDSSASAYGCKPMLYETSILENFTMGKARIYTALILAIPAALAITGTVILIRRKNR